MSVNRDMRNYKLQRNRPVRSPSGAPKDNWIDIKDIKAAVYKKDDMRVFSSEKYIESTHVGLTYCKEIATNINRLICNDIVYDVIGCNPDGRLTVLLLKAVT